MKIDTLEGNTRRQVAGRAAFTLVEVAFAAAIAALVLAGMFQGYNMAGRRSQFAACSLAANAAAMSQLEQVISAPWNLSGNNALLLESMTTNGNLCMPSANGSMLNASKIVSVSTVSGASSYATVKVECIWTFPAYGGVFTNTIAVIRAPDL